MLDDVTCMFFAMRWLANLLADATQTVVAFAFACVVQSRIAACKAGREA